MAKKKESEKYVANLTFEGFAEGKVFPEGEEFEMSEERVEEVMKSIRAQGYTDFEITKVKK